MSARFPESLTVQEVASRFGGALRRGAPDTRVHALATLDQAGPDDLSFLASASFAPQAGGTRAAAVLVNESQMALLPGSTGVILHPNPYAAYAMVSAWIDQARFERDAPEPGVHPTALIGSGVTLGTGVRIGPGVQIGADAWIGDGVALSAGAFVGARARIGEGSVLMPRVVVYHDCVLGARGIVHSGTVIGSDGFGFAPQGGRWVKIAQVGRVVIGDDVEIGANCTIDRGALDDTRIADGCKLDNQIQVGHNVQIGEHTAIAACVGIAGSVRIGRRCQIGGAAGISGHLDICDDVIVGGKSTVFSSITRPGHYTGVFPLLEQRDWERVGAVVRQLPELRRRLRQLERTTGQRDE